MKMKITKISLLTCTNQVLMLLVVIMKAVVVVMLVVVKKGVDNEGGGCGDACGDDEGWVQPQPLDSQQNYH